VRDRHNDRVLLTLTATATPGFPLEVADLSRRVADRTLNVDLYRTAYRRYVWATRGLDGIQVAPFQLLASKGATWHQRDHLWHLDLADRLAHVDPSLFRMTRRLVVDTAMPEHLNRLKERNLGHNRSLALREYALGLESLDRLVRGEPLWRVHEPVFAVLALESEPVDPRL